MMKVNLTQRIWLSFIALIVLVGLTMVIVYPISIKGTLTDETYRIIEQEQARMANPFSDYFTPPQSELDFIERREAERSVGHLFLFNNLGTLRGEPVPPDSVLKEMIRNTINQEQERDRYELTYNDATLFYVITRIESDGEEAFQISYMWDTYRDLMVNRLWERLVYLLLITSALSLLPAIWLKRYLRQPLRMLGNHFEQIAKRNWREPFRWEGDDDFQKLSDQFEQMRQNLIRYDRSQKTFIQHASHELKTPIMVVKTYAQSVKDGIPPKDNIEETMDVILDEANRMDKRVKDMLYFTKLDALQQETINAEEMAFGYVAFQIEERFRMQREDVTFVIRGADVTIDADKEQIQVLLENLVENAMRYAKDTIWIMADAENDMVNIHVKNNGPAIPQEDAAHIFSPFRKGNKGQFGLGLAIVKRITELHQGDAEVINEDDGVRFKVTLPKKDREKIDTREVNI
ncbi:two-component system, OmpR family, sensor histidine kinase CssS [Alteribacillus persepolensis]|uniref:histidine kinase n=1 Tax=Alteribacillus persepolensis TaxID=568899 RepID=A0A1G8DEP3_9BACI|nr:HAMP domain-containing sensor histidine kinase [Alteribacillus persepolensis]SDH55770.1 two-component system, OmpR family, sensor histidine kinase CssS [Alteribacillus persepolensis]